MKRRIRKNAWGNWNGYEGNRKVIEFGSDERAANVWLRDPAEHAREQQEARNAVKVRSVHTKKPVIRFIPNGRIFTSNGDYITNAKAREIWDAGTGDWTQGAYKEMSRMVLIGF